MKPPILCISSRDRSQKPCGYTWRIFQCILRVVTGIQLSASSPNPKKSNFLTILSYPWVFMVVAKKMGTSSNNGSWRHHPTFNVGPKIIGWKRLSIRFRPSKCCLAWILFRGKKSLNNLVIFTYIDLKCGIGTSFLGS